MTYVHSEPTGRGDAPRPSFSALERLFYNAAPAPQSELHATVAKLRAFSRLLCMHNALADRLVEITLLRASVAMSERTLGSNSLAWLCARLRSYFYAEAAESLAANPGPVAGRQEPLLAALGALSPNQREALLLTDAMGFSGRQAARICRCPPRRFLGRVEAARTNLLLFLAQSSRRQAEDARPQSPGTRAAA